VTNILHSLLLKQRDKIAYEKVSCHKETMRLLHESLLSKYNWKTIFCEHYRSIFNPCDVIGLQSDLIRWNNAKEGLLRRSKSFNVIYVGTNLKPVCDFLLVINTDRPPISCRFEIIVDYCSNFDHFVFLSPRWGLGATYTVHLRLIGNLVDF